MSDLIKALMQRDSITKENAEDMVHDARQRVINSEDPEEILHYEFGLEPDFVFDLF